MVYSYKCKQAVRLTGSPSDTGVTRKRKCSKDIFTQCQPKKRHALSTPIHGMQHTGLSANATVAARYQCGSSVPAKMTGSARFRARCRNLAKLLMKLNALALFAGTPTRKRRGCPARLRKGAQVALSRQQIWRKARVEAGYCGQCGKSRDGESKWLCSRCAAMAADAAIAWKQQRIDAGLCVRCGLGLGTDPTGLYCRKCADKYAKAAAAKFRRDNPGAKRRKKVSEPRASR